MSLAAGGHGFLQVCEPYSGHSLCQTLLCAEEFDIKPTDYCEKTKRLWQQEDVVGLGQRKP